MSLALAIQIYRIRQGQSIIKPFLDTDEARKLQSSPIWEQAHHLLHQFEPELHELEGRENEVDAFTILLLAGAKNERWPGDIETEKEFDFLIFTVIAIGGGSV